MSFHSSYFSKFNDDKQQTAVLSLPIYANGHQNNIIDKMQTRKRLYELVEYEKYNSLDEKIYNFSTEGHE